MRVKQYCRCFVLLVLTSVAAWSQKAAHHKPGESGASSAEKRTAAYFDSVRNQPSLLLDFLHRMPKGADLHNHLSGAIYAESFIQWAVQDGLCVDVSTSTFLACDRASDKPRASSALTNSDLYTHLLEAFSMRGWSAARESGHDHFFATFGKFGAATNGHTADMLVEVREEAARENLLYMELMFNPDNGQAASLGKRVGWQSDLGKMREAMLSDGLPEIVTQASKSLDQIEAKEKEEMHCGQPQGNPGCNVEARYLYQVARGLPKEMVFAQILAGFEMASKDPRVVGLNLVMAEDWYVPVHDFRLHMQMLDYLHKLYPKVHITLHAGELTPELVPPEDLFHIRASIDIGHAERIGHGIDVMQEQDPIALLKEMAAKKILVEICLTSNDVILGVSGARHPLPMYLKYGVPVALATDDAGVSRSSITQEYERAVETYHFSYRELKKMVRASLEYSFLPPTEKSTEEKQLDASFGRFEKEFTVPAKTTGQDRPAKKRP
jgi:adenosine deaminase